MANIKTYLNNIKTAVFGSEVRDSIHDAIQQCYDDASAKDNANMEVKMARGEYENLGKRLDSHSSQIKEKANQSDLEVERSRIDSFVSLEEGSTTGDAELIDARIGADGITYKNLGSSIRTQISNIKEQKEILTYILDDWTIGGLFGGAIVAGTTTRIVTSNIHYFENDFNIEMLNDYSIVIAKYSNSLESSFISQSSNWETGLIECEKGYYRFMIKDKAGTTQGDLSWSKNINIFSEFKFYFDIKDQSIDYPKLKFLTRMSGKNLAYLDDKVIAATGWSLDLRDQLFTLTRTGDVNSNGLKGIDIPITLDVGTYTISSANENFTDNIGYLVLYNDSKEICAIQPASASSLATFTLNKKTTLLLKYNLLCEGFNSAIDKNSTIQFNIQVEKGNNVSKYEKPIRKYGFNDTEVTLNNFLNEFSKNNLYGKTWNALGDSITAGLGSTIPYHSIIGSNNNMTVNNYGISGTTIAKGSVSNPMCERYVNMNDNADVISVFGGTNDFGQQISLGGNDSTDTTTFKGALNVLIEGLINKYPGKRLYFFTPLQRADVTNLPIKLVEYVDAMIEICGLWGVPCKDLYRGSGLYVKNEFIQNNYFRIDETNKSDKLHPNNKGHEVIALPIEGFMKNN